MQKIKVSVIIPTYGRSEYLIRAVESVLNQTYDDIEIIIVDDNGTDTLNQIKTESKIKDYIAENDRIKYIKHKNNMNGSVARNTGIKQATGEYICFLDDDDEFLNRKTELQLEFLESKGPTWVACFTGHNRVFVEKDRVVPYTTEKQGNILFDVLMSNIDACSGSTLMIRKSSLMKIGGFDTQLKRHQDYEFLARVAHLGNIGVISEPMVNIYTHSGSYSQKKYEDIVETRLQYYTIIEPLLQDLTAEEVKLLNYSMHYELLKTSLKHKKIRETAKYIFKTKKPLKAMIMATRDSYKFIYKR